MYLIYIESSFTSLPQRCGTGLRPAPLGPSSQQLWDVFAVNSLSLDPCNWECDGRHVAKDELQPQVLEGLSPLVYCW